MQPTPYLLALLITATLSGLLALVVWRRRQAPGAAPLTVLMLAVALWSFTYLRSLAGTSLEEQLFWANMAYFGIVLVPVSWLAFALDYSGAGHLLTARRLLPLAAMPLATLAAVWTNEQHRLFRSAVALVDAGSFVVLEAVLGPLFWLHTAYSYLLLLLGTLLLARSLFRMSPSYRAQAGGLFVGVATPWVGNALYLSGLSPFPYLDLTPFAFGVSGIALCWDLLRSGLFDLVPVAHGAVFQSIADGVMVLDGRGRIVDINPAGLALLGRSAREVIGAPAQQTLASWPDIVARYRGVREAHEELLLMVDGATRAFDLHISPLYDRHGTLNGRVVVLHDISERRRAAAELQQHNQELAALAAANARLYHEVQQELAERRHAEVSLSLAKEAAEVANRAKSRFLGNMSHELRTPLTAILGYADLLELEASQLDNAQLLSDIQSIQVAGHFLLDLIGDVLDLTRIEAERLDLRPDHFEIAALVASLAETVAPLVEKNGNTLRVECSPELGTMYADITRVRQVLLNLLGNAAKFTEGGLITLRVAPYPATPENTTPLLTFAISDTGIGIPSEQLPLLFNEFVQVDDSPTRPYGGSGLGLAISGRLCKLMGGTIAVVSEPGNGSTFTVTLPRKAPEQIS